jgi:hypothetical protein
MHLLRHPNQKNVAIQLLRQILCRATGFCDIIVSLSETRVGCIQSKEANPKQKLKHHKTIYFQSTMTQPCLGLNPRIVLRDCAAACARARPSAWASLIRSTHLFTSFFDMIKT